MSNFDIIRRPRVTEKSVYLQNEHNTYSFEVLPTANKSEIKKAVESLFKVKVTKVTTATFMGKWKRTRTKLPGMTSNWKKAMVTVADGQRIEGI